MILKLLGAILGENFSQLGFCLLEGGNVEVRWLYVLFVRIEHPSLAHMDWLGGGEVCGFGWME